MGLSQDYGKLHMKSVTDHTKLNPNLYFANGNTGTGFNAGIELLCGLFT
jgi:hypothetical protein